MTQNNSSRKGKGWNSEYTETSGGKTINGLGTKARYVRVWVNGSNKTKSGNLVELKVWGTTTDKNRPLPPLKKLEADVKKEAEEQAPVEASYRNLAKGAAVQVKEWGSAPELVTDDDTDANNFCDLGTGSQYVTVDLGRPYMIDKVNLWRYYGDGRTYHDTVVQVSNSADFSSGVTTVFNNDSDNSSGQGAGTDAEYAETQSGKEIKFTAVMSRYVRVYTNGSTSNDNSHVVELQVRGEIYKNLALNKTITAKDYASVIERIADGDKDTANFCDLGFDQQYVTIDLGGEHTVAGINVWHYYGDGRTYHDVVVQLSNSSDFTTDVTTVYNNDTDNSSKLGTGTDKEYSETEKGLVINISPVKAKYARLYSNGSSSNSNDHLVEVEIWGY